MKMSNVLCVVISVIFTVVSVFGWLQASNTKAELGVLQDKYTDLQKLSEERFDTVLKAKDKEERLKQQLDSAVSKCMVQEEIINNVRRFIDVKQLEYKLATTSLTQEHADAVKQLTGFIIQVPEQLRNAIVLSMTGSKLIGVHETSTDILDGMDAILK